MKTDSTYEIAHLNQSLVQEIVDLEQRLKKETGHPVTLIAYSQTEAYKLQQEDMGLDSELGCRAGIDD